MAHVPAKKVKAEAPQVRAKSGPAVRSVFAQHQDVAVDSLLRLLLEPLASLLTWIVIAIALALPLTLILLLQNLRQIGGGLDQPGTISLFMRSNVPAQTLEKITADFATLPNVAEARLITADQALQEFEQNSGFGEALQGLDANPLPAVILVTPAVNSQAEVEVLHKELATHASVEYAQLDLRWLQRLNAIVELASRMAVVLAMMLGVGVILVIGNTIRLAIENRRAEIVVTKLVGGTDSYVSRPFLYTGLWYGVGGGLLAVILIDAVMFGLRGPVAGVAGVYGSNFSLTGLGISNSFLVVTTAGILGWLGAWVSVMRHLRAIEPR